MLLEEGLGNRTAANLGIVGKAALMSDSASLMQDLLMDNII